MRTRTMLTTTEAREPLGIVIADGGPADAAPRFSAFVWGPVPDDLEQEAQDKQLAVAAA
jgi:hypothetical protein